MLYCVHKIGPIVEKVAIGSMVSGRLIKSAFDVFINLCLTSNFRCTDWPSYERP